VLSRHTRSCCSITKNNQINHY